MTIPGFDEFELDIERAFRDYLPPFLEQVTAVPLTLDNIRAIPANKNGVYLLLEKNVIRYVGKTDSKGGFQNRLTRHSNHIKHRRNIDPRTIYFKAIAIPVFKNADIESMLVEHYGASWNNSGFGSNDPGKERDTQQPADFDLSHPINVDIPLDFIITGPVSCRNLLFTLATELPYTFRFERRGHKDDLNFEINIPPDCRTMNNIMQLVVNSLPQNKWQASVFSGRVILYSEIAQYEHAQRLIRSNI